MEIYHLGNTIIKCAIVRGRYSGKKNICKSKHKTLNIEKTGGECNCRA